MTSERWEQINQIYYATLEVARSERAVFLDNACDGDAGLRRRWNRCWSCMSKAEGFLGKSAMDEVAQEIRQGFPC